MSSLASTGAGLIDIWLSNVIGSGLVLVHALFPQELNLNKNDL